MKRIFFVLVLLLLVGFARAKDINAWKSEENLNAQFEVFKKNLNYWNGNYFMKPFQLDEFYKAVSDSLAREREMLAESRKQIEVLTTELREKKQKIETLNADLNKSLELQDTIEVVGIGLHKNVYTLVVGLIILGLLVLCGGMFLMYDRSRKVTVRTKTELAELKEEFESYKKASLDRYTKINMELHKTRLELQKK